MKKRLTLQGGPLSLWCKTAGRARALLVVLLLWLAAAQAMAGQINGVAVYDKTTGVLTFDSWDADKGKPVAEENQELYLLWDPAVSGKDYWFGYEGEKSCYFFNWSLTTRQATRVVFKDGFQAYKVLPTCHAMFKNFENLKTIEGLDYINTFNTTMTDMGKMFYYCNQLRDIYVGDGFTTAGLREDNAMFSGCVNLPDFDSNEKRKTRVHYGNGGYFQRLVGRVGDRKIGARGDELTANRVTLSDGDDLEIYQQFTASELTYTRTMDDRQWQAAYLPFSVTADALPEGYMAAAINDFHEYDQQDGTCHVELEARQIAAGESIDALTPFILRRVQDGVEPLTLRVEGVELTTDLMRTSTCASVERLYTFLGTMQTITTPGNQDTYFMQDADLALVSQPTQLPAGRWCMTVSNRSGSTSARALPSHISVKVSGDATAISTGYRGTSTDTTAVYDLQGRRLTQEPQHGVYIKGGKKYVK